MVDQLILTDPSEIAFVLALRAYVDTLTSPPPAAPNIRSSAYWLQQFPDAFNTGDKAATREDYRQWPTREDRIYFAGYPIEALAKVWKLGGDSLWLDTAYEMAMQGFQTIGRITNHVALNELLFLRGVSFLVDQLPAGNTRRADLVEGRRSVWDFHHAAGNLKRDITHILGDAIMSAYSIVSSNPSRVEQAQDLITWAEPRLKGAYDAARDGVWIMSISHDPRYPGPPDVGHACRDAAMVSRCVDAGYDDWQPYADLMTEVFWNVYNTTTRRFAWNLDGTGVPPSHNFGFLWASVGLLDVNVQKAFEAYCEPYQGRQSDAYLALWYAQMAWNAAKWGA